MNLRHRPTGWDNPRARPFVGHRVLVTRLHQLYGAKLGQRRAGRNAGSLEDFPPVLQLQTKTGCNASCAICPQTKTRDMFPEATMSGDLYRRIVEQCRNQPNLHGVGFVLHNEPLTDPMLFDRIRHFRERVKTRAMTFMVTNGTLLTPEVSDELLSSGLDALHISCNGFGKEDYESVNNGKSWDKFQANLEHFLSRDLSRIAVMLSFVRHNLYRREMEEAVRYWRSRGVQSFIHGINNRGGMVDDYDQYVIPLDREPWPVRCRKVLVKRFFGCCPYPFLQMSVLATGQVLICTHDWARRQIVGDLNQQTILDVWNGPIMRDVRLQLLSGNARDIPSCRHCDVFTNASFA